jgi:hypothetical protein
MNRMDTMRPFPYHCPRRLSMSSCYRRAAFAFVWVILGAAPVAAQSGSSIVVRDLTSRLAAMKIDSIAARVPGTDDTFVAALYLPGQQLVVVSGRYAVPALIREKIIRGRYRDAYLDIFSATDRSTRRVVEDLRADGLQPTREKNGPFDTYTRRGGESVQFDGDWKRRKMSERAYMDAFRHADSAYTEMIKTLISELEHGPTPPLVPPSASRSGSAAP